jgi:hypothetical protein
MKTIRTLSIQSVFHKNVLLLFTLLIFSIPGFSQYWELLGNTGTTPGTGLGQNYVGTADNEGLMFGVDGQQCGYIDIILDNTSLGQGSLLASHITSVMST